MRPRNTTGPLFTLRPTMTRRLCCSLSPPQISPRVSSTGPSSAPRLSKALDLVAGSTGSSTFNSIEGLLRAPQFHELARFRASDALPHILVQRARRRQTPRACGLCG